ncbi:antitoxin Xre/MbcA/ParS toxin-binding domain-containing protein [Thioclava sp. F34-6]|uniref:antitoxin Xre/MbcA/ParS toxin-binding domain-containing protein n=1 Tax=Thioclava sp. F34-6 TaxID=1973003 RepID=UPI001F0B02AB|nr:antitoxin Xre/MbcA/ParS toxin-binding domain-containing protein [Thioclava sp. F34-6]
MSFLTECMRDDRIDLGLIAAKLGTSEEDIAEATGLDRDAHERPARVGCASAQRRLRKMLEILDRVIPRVGTPSAAYAWYRAEPLPGFSGSTPMQLVLQGRAAEVINYIDAVDAGVYS